MFSNVPNQDHERGTFRRDLAAQQQGDQAVQGLPVLQRGQHTQTTHC